MDSDSIFYFIFMGGVVFFSFLNSMKKAKAEKEQREQAMRNQQQPQPPLPLQLQPHVFDDACCVLSPHAVRPIVVPIKDDASNNAIILFFINSKVLPYKCLKAFSYILLQQIGSLTYKTLPVHHFSRQAARILP